MNSNASTQSSILCRRFDTGFPADSVEFCPHPQAGTIFVCGTYKLDESDSTSGRPRRLGRCLVFDVAETDEFKLVQEFDVPAILDMKWCHSARLNMSVLGIADSEGNILLHAWDIHEKKMAPLQSINCAPSDVLCLSLDWSNRLSSDSGLGSMIVSRSDGFLSLLHPDDQNVLRPFASWQAHDFEPWVAAWDYWNTNVVFSGGDDLKLKCWDIRQEFSSPILVNTCFDAGVTSIQSHPHLEHILAVGSYDDTVRLFDNRKFVTPVGQVKVGGGAWRVKWHPLQARQNDLLVACMHDGFKVVRFQLTSSGTNEQSESDVEGEVLKRFDAHESLAYGVDWSYLESGVSSDENLVASCSFYDHVLYTWRG